MMQPFGFSDDNDPEKFSADVSFIFDRTFFPL